MDLSEINWDFNAAGGWPLQIKAAIIFLICCCVAGAGVYYFTLDQLTELEALEKTEADLTTEFETKQAKAVNLPDYQHQLKQIEIYLSDMLKQMPNKKEVANLLFEISQIAATSGLDSKLFQPEPEIKQDFYTELPTSVEMVGKYEELGLFVSGVAAMSRIVTVHDIKLDVIPKTEQDKSGETRMTMKATIKTYTDSSAEENAEKPK